MRRHYTVSFVCIAIIAIVALCIPAEASLPKEFQEVRARIEALMKKPGLMSRRNLMKGLQAETCGKKVGGNYYNLGRLEDMDFPDTTGEYKMQGRFCVSKSSKCGGSNVVLCQTKDDDPSFATPIAKFDNTYPTWSTIDGGQTGVQLKFKNGDSGGCGGPRELTWKFICDPNNKQPVNQFYEMDVACTYYAETTSSLVCPTSAPSGGSGMSGGTVFLIILLVVIPVYIAAGCFYNYKKTDKRGCEACPQKAFWCGLWVNAKAGCAFTWAKLRGLCSGNKHTSTGEYESA